MDIISYIKSKLALLKANQVEQDLTNHTTNENNPHNVTPALIGAVPTGRAIQAGNNLSGGGDLSTNRTLSLVDDPEMRYPKAYSLDSPGDYHLYIRAGSGKTIRATENGTETSYIPIHANDFVTSSTETQKENIEEWNDNLLERIKNFKLYKYNIKGETDHVKYGFVIGENYQVPDEILSKEGDGIEQYNFNSLNLKLILELSNQLDQLKQEIETLKGR